MNLHKKNPKRTWDCLKQITGSGKDRVKVKVSNELSYANELNRFYCRFDIFDFKKEQESVKRALLSKLVRPHLEVTAKTVEKEFSIVTVRQ